MATSTKVPTTLSERMGLAEDITDGSTTEDEKALADIVAQVGPAAKDSASATKTARKRNKVLARFQTAACRLILLADGMQEIKSGIHAGDIVIVNSLQFATSAEQDKE